MRIDVERLDSTIKDVSDQIKVVEKELTGSPIWSDHWSQIYDKPNLGSRVQLGGVLFSSDGQRKPGNGSDHTKRLKAHGLGLIAPSRTKTGRPQMTADVLDKIDYSELEESKHDDVLAFIAKYVRLEKLKKLDSTYLKNVKRETVDGFMHPFFNLHLARTHRSSSNAINFQNVPIRDPLIGKLIRSCFVPRPGHVLVEIDYSALEFRIAACFWADEKMCRYAADPSLDIHRDLAAEIYKLPADEVPKKVRFFGKNQFVFPILYGSYYCNCARNLWTVIETDHLETLDGLGLREHLKQVGIKSLGACDSKLSPKPRTFEAHVQKVEQHFNRRFPEWSKRKDEWWMRYLKRGSFRMMTGFECKGVLGRNDLYNWPIQGPAFHLLLWSLIQLVRWLTERRMRTKIVGQIHDSIVADVHEEELDDYIQKAKQVMTEDVVEHYDWIRVPLDIEVEVAKTSWHEKEAIEI